jgi:hypothetical protein
MLKLLKKEANRAYTENMAVTRATTCSDNLDMFAAVGALRGAEGCDIENRFMRAYAENPDIAMKLAFFARDIRGGLGERRVFRTILRWLAKNEPESARKNIENVPEYGRFDDLLALIGSSCERDALDFVSSRLESDARAMENGLPVSLLAKWLPSVNTSNAETVKTAKRVARFLGMSDADYRKKLSGLRAYIRIIENSLRTRDYSFDYEHQPSGAMFKYRKAFLRNDGERYGAFMSRVSSGEARLRTGSLTPYDIITPFFSGTVSGGGARRHRRDVEGAGGFHQRRKRPCRRGRLWRDVCPRETAPGRNRAVARRLLCRTEQGGVPQSLRDVLRKPADGRDQGG